ncbi:MAG: N-acetylmuramoyl-L-alanine amidase [Candidatus Firestonebacteria bacterium]
MRIKITILIILAFFCLGAQSLKDRIIYSEVQVTNNGQPGKVKVFTLTRGFDTYYHLKGICQAYNISFSYVPSKNRVLMNKGINSMRLTIGAEPALKEYALYSSKKYFLSAEGLNYVFSGLIKGSVKLDKKSKILEIQYEAPKKPAKIKNLPQVTAVPPGNVRIIPLLQGEKFQVQRIIIDAGHGGKDPGAVGKDGLQEKTVTLDLAVRTAALIKEKLKKEVFLTRDRDVYISLQERSALANKNKGDIFVAIHANANTDRRAEGTDIYIYDAEPSDKRSGNLAIRENMEYLKSGGIKSVLSELSFKSNDNLSVLLAGNILDNIVNNVDVQSRNKNMILRAPFYVIAHANMPAVLVEVAFITNREEERKLRENEFRDSVAKAICQGVEDFISATMEMEKEDSTAVLREPVTGEYSEAGYKAP